MSIDISESPVRRRGYGEIYPTLPVTEFTTPVYECHVRICEDSDGGYCGYVANLPGVVSQGNTIEDAIANTREAAEAALMEYKERGSIPWGDFDLELEVTVEKRILIDV